MPAFSTSAEEIEAEIRALPITFDPIPGGEQEALSQSDQELFENYFHEAPKGTARSIRRIKHLTRKYPKVVALKNHLSVAYNAAGKYALADKLTQEIFEKHPDYLFGRINYATMFLEEEAELH